jgi:site-specific DNA-adenine methylase
MTVYYIDPKFDKTIILPKQEPTQSLSTPIPRPPGCTCRYGYPVFAYPGSKGRLSRRICERAPREGKVFCDVFAGRGSVTFAAMTLLDYEHYWINAVGTDKFFYGLWQRSRFKDDLERQRSKEFYEEIKRLAESQYVKPTRAALMEAFLCFSGGNVEDAGLRTSGGGVSQPGYQHKVEHACALLVVRDHRITNMDFADALAELTSHDFAFVDPPYKNAKVKSYDDTMLDHRELVRSLLDAPFKWMLTEYRNDVYLPLTEKFGEPEEIEVQKTMDNSNYTYGDRKKVVECIWKNY